MENVTHTLVGYFLARAGLDRQSPHATAICIVAANIPDIDLVTFTSPINYLNYHRHLTHSLSVVPLMGALAVAVIALWLRLFRPAAPSIHWKSAWPIATLVALTHPLLDLMNPYAIRLWLPFSGRWESWDVLFVWEPWLWVWLFAAAFAVWIVRRRGASSKYSRASAQLAGIALAGLLAFIALKSTLHDRAIEVLRGIADGDVAVERLAAFPHVFDPFAWTGLIETSNEFRVFQLSDVGLGNSNGSPRTKGPNVYRKFAPPPQVRPTLESGVAKDYLRFAQYAAGTMEPTVEGYVIRFFDLRFGQGNNQNFVCTITLDGAFRKVSESFRWR